MTRAKTERTPLPDIRRGDILADKYRGERILGKGGMGIVVAATHLDLHEQFAIKLMLPEQLAKVVLDRTPCERPTKYRPDLDPALERVILHCLEHDHKARMPSMIDLMVALEPFLPNESVDEDETTIVLNKAAVLEIEQATARSAVNPEIVREIRDEMAADPFERLPKPSPLLRTLPILPAPLPLTPAPRQTRSEIPSTAPIDPPFDAFAPYSPIPGPASPGFSPPRAPPLRWPIPSQAPTGWAVAAETAPPPSSAPPMLASVNALNMANVEMPVLSLPPLSPMRRSLLAIALIMAIAGILMLVGAVALLYAWPSQRQVAHPSMPTPLLSVNLVKRPTPHSPEIVASSSAPPSSPTNPTASDSSASITTKVNTPQNPPMQSSSGSSTTPPNSTIRPENKKKPTSPTDIWKQTDKLF